VSDAARLSRAATDPLRNKLVRQIAPSRSIWKHGSPGPRRNGKRAFPGLTAPENVTVRALLTMCSRRVPRLIDPDDHKSGWISGAGVRGVIDQPACRA
jgi:hypothetical protein